MRKYLFFIGVGDLLHCRAPSEFLRGKDRERAVLAAVRQSLKKANYENFDMLLEAFRHYDKVSAFLKKKSLTLALLCHGDTDMKKHSNNGMVDA